MVWDPIFYSTSNCHLSLAVSFPFTSTISQPTWMLVPPHGHHLLLPNFSPCLHFGPSYNSFPPCARGNHGKCNDDCISSFFKTLSMAYKAFHYLCLAVQPFLPPFLHWEEYSGSCWSINSCPTYSCITGIHFLMKGRICSYFYCWKPIEPLIGYTPAFLLSEKKSWNVDPEENQSEGIDTYIITLGHSYITLGQLKKSQEEGILLGLQRQQQKIKCHH